MCLLVVSFGVRICTVVTRNWSHGSEFLPRTQLSIVTFHLVVIASNNLLKLNVSESDQLHLLLNCLKRLKASLGKTQKSVTEVVFGLAQLLSEMMQEVDLLTYTDASSQGAIKRLWLHFLGVLMCLF